MYAAPHGEFDPRFGPDSRAAHVDAGAWGGARRAAASLRRDVDDVADLREAQALGVGVHTAELAEGPETQ